MSTKTNQPRQPKGTPTGGQWRATARPEGPALADDAPGAGHDWWPMADSTTRPGEKALVCPKCGSQDVVISGSNLGSDMVRGMVLGQLRCRSCGHRQHFRPGSAR
ncbi:MAG: hypothetical protein ACP5VR_13015 [Acidimicrobiales bacterium]